MSKIQNCKDLLDNSFGDNWINNYNVVADSETALLEITSAILSFSKDFFENLNLSVIKGEYINFHSDIDSTLVSIEDHLKSIAETQLDLASPENNGDLFIILSSNFTSILLTAVKRYKSLINKVYRGLLRNDGSFTLLDVLSKENMIFSDPTGDKINDYLNLFNNNILLAKIDHSIKVDEKTLANLTLIRNNLKILQTPEYYVSYLKHKCNFLIFKISFRLQTEGKRYITSIDLSEEEILSVKDDFSYFKDIKTDIESHYNDDSEPEREVHKRRANELFNKIKQHKSVTFLDFHSATKYFKDYRKSLTKLEQVSEAFSKEFENLEEGNPFDKRAFEISKSYIENNIFSLKLESEFLTVSEWSILLDEIVNNQRDLSINNYFPYFRSITFLEGKIQKEIKAEVLNLSNLNVLITEYASTLKDLIKNSRQCQEKNFLAFQLPFSESVYKGEPTPGKEIMGFVSSSFVLPVNYEDLYENIKDFEANLRKYRIMYEIREAFEKDTREIKSLRNDMDNADKRNIEILSIFAAIVLFVAGDIQLFTKMTDPLLAIKFMFLFGFVLACFVLLIWFITRADGFRFKNIPLIHFIIMGFFMLGFVFCFGLIKGWFDEKAISPKEQTPSVRRVNQRPF